jgi:S1-C subfamily serine protease
MESVIKIFCTHTDPNFSLPWQKKRQYQSTGSGFAIGNRRLLTNAHCVEHHTQIKVKRRGDDTRFTATVLAIGEECDVAMLTVEDDVFWEDLAPLSFGSLPNLQDPVTVVGYPVGGDTMSVSSGVVSRVEVTEYAHGHGQLLGVQIDAAINAGNSGGPAFNLYGECVGIAFQSLKHKDAENIGYIIPTPVVSHFLRDYDRNGKYTGFPAMGIECQNLESPFLRKSMGMTEEQKGVLVRRVEPTSKAAEHLSPGDVILSFDGTDVSNDGTVPFRRGERMAFNYLVSSKFDGDKAGLRILRAKDRKVVELEVPLGSVAKVVPVHIGGRSPSYFITGGLVFTVATIPYLQSEYGTEEYEYDAPVRLLSRMMYDMPATADEQVVIVGHVLASASEVTLGYDGIVNTEVVAFNGTPLRNLKQLASLVDGCKDQYMRFEMADHRLVLLEATAAREETERVLDIYGIPRARSQDLIDDARNKRAEDTS